MGQRRVGEAKRDYRRRHAKERKCWCVRHPGANAASSRSFRLSHPARNLWHLAKHRAKTEGVVFSITDTDILIPDVCPLLGVKLLLDGPKNYRPSLDRIIPDLGYVPGNVWVVSFRGNRLKNDATPDELQRMTAAVLLRVNRSPIEAQL